MNFAIIYLNKLFKQINFAKLMANLDSAMPRYPWNIYGLSELSLKTLWSRKMKVFETWEIHVT